MVGCFDRKANIHLPAILLINYPTNKLLMNSLYSVIKKFIVTNKSTDGEIRGVYTCIVDMAATKIDIKNAMKALYDVEVTHVNVLHTRPKFRRTKTGIGRRQ
jgi:ribosomal protein L23